MISDVLSDAVRQMKGYMEDFPKAYGCMEEELRELLVHMNGIRVRLDCPLTDEECAAMHGASVNEK